MPTYDLVDTKNVRFGVVQDDISHHQLVRTSIGAGWVFDKASQEEVMEFQNRMRVLSEFSFMSRPTQEMTYTIESKSSKIFRSIDNPNAWRYSVVRPESAEILGAHLSEALRISDAEMLVELWAINQNDGIHKFGGRFRNCIQHIGHPPDRYMERTINLTELKECVELRAKFNSEKFPSIEDTIQRFRQLDALPSNPLKTLGYFGIIEALLSHSPKSNESADSISRQLRRNLLLIENRLSDDEKMGFNDFGEALPSKVITKLYDFRSAIAHGSNPEISLNWLIEQGSKCEGSSTEKPSQGGQSVQVFIRRIVRRILKQALREPQLITDLKG